MKMKAENRELGRYGTNEERQFQIRGSAKAFKILSDGLYSDKIGAIIRELSCNAKDAHVDDGKGDVPFEVHLPNALEPWFAVTDFGIGLSHEDVMHLYSTYFESTKTDSNNVTGCLGLGSKSPFAYVDAFTVEARWNGKLTLYSCFYNEEGIPSIAVMGDPMDTKETNGLTIKMAVKEDDMREFATKASTALSRFNPTPIVTGNTDYEIETIEYMAEGTNWKMLKRETQRYGHNGRINAIQGNVTYPVDMNQLNTLSDAQKSIMDINADLFFEIGELDVAANREALGYDEATIANIKYRLDVVAKELPPLFQDKFKDCKTLWDARILFNEISSELSYGLKNLLADKDVGLKWKNQSLDKAFKIDPEQIKVGIVQFQRGYRGNRGAILKDDWGRGHKFVADKNILFFYDDVGHGSHARMSHYIETTEGGDGGFRYAYLIKSETKKVLKAVSKALGDVTIQPVSNLPKRPKAEKAALRVTSKVLQFTGDSYDRRNSWEPTELDLKTGGMYVTINRFKVYDGDNEVTNLSEIIDLAASKDIADLTGKPIYGIRKGDVAKLPEDSDWVDLFDLLRSKVKDVLDTENIATLLADYSEFHGFSFNLNTFENSLLSANFASASPMATFIGAYKFMKDQDSDRARVVAAFAHKVRYELETVKAAHDLEKLWRIVTIQYPLIPLLDNHTIRGGYYSDDKKTVKENFASLMNYIAAIDLMIEAAEDDAA